ncbi:leucine-rich repeat-containing protein 15-like [Culicoides brevitarsis]|uniref:leucine-rich repeat-containing protein 15-like n=1 Tax=Culicoides brevitarsis TaxID=469753 RepID=UPI00307C06C1
MNKWLCLWFLLLPSVLKAHYLHECKEGYRKFQIVCTFVNIRRNNTIQNAAFEMRSNQYIRTVIFENSTISELPRTIFQKLPNLENLTMSNVGLIDELHKYSFEKANALIILNLMKNNLTAVEKHTFSEAKKIQIIDLSYNSISKVDVLAFETTNLRRLTLSQNLLESLPNEIFNKVQNISMIDLSYNKLRDIERHLFINCKKLQNLNLQGNHLKHIALTLPFTVRSLDFSDNRIEDIFIEPIHNRTNIDLRELLRFIANNNSINSFDVHTDFILTYVDLTQNNLSDIKNISKMSTIIELSLAFNPDIGELPLNVFENMTSLLSLNLEHTNLGRLDFGTFSQTTKLRSLDISYNNLDEIDLDMLAALSSLEEISLIGNNLTKLEYNGLIELFPKLRFIGISNNNFECKNLANILKYLNKQNIRLLEDPYKENHLMGQNLKGISCHNTPAVLHTEKQIQDINDIQETKARLAKISGRKETRTIDSDARVKDEGSSADVKAIKIMVFTLLLINLIFFGIKLGRYLKTKKSSHSMRLSGAIQEENLMEDLVS